MRTHSSSRCCAIDERKQETLCLDVSVWRRWNGRPLSEMPVVRKQTNITWKWNHETNIQIIPALSDHPDLITSCPTWKTTTPLPHKQSETVRLCLARVHQLEDICREATSIYRSAAQIPAEGTSPRAACAFPCECECLSRRLERSCTCALQLYHQR